MVVLQHTGGVERGQRSVVLLHEVVVVTTVVQVVTQAGDKQANSLGRGGGVGVVGREKGRGMLHYAEVTETFIRFNQKH